MSKIGRSRVTRLIFFLYVAIAAGAAFFSPAAAAAGPLDGLTGPVEETVRTATSAVNQVAATATASPPVASPPPVPRVDDKALPDVSTGTSQALSEGAKKPTPAGKLPLPAVKLPGPSGQPPVSLGDSEGDSPAGPVTRTVETATRTAKTTVEALGQTVESTSSSALDRATGTAPTPTNRHDAEAPGPEASAPADEASAYVGGRFLPSPSEDGSVRAPLGKFAAYIWPAVALTRVAMPGLAKDWAKDALRRALDPADATASSGAAQGVEGAHAEHRGSQSSGPSLFSQIPFALTGGYGPDIPLPAMVFYLVVIIGIFGVLLAMLWDLEYLGRSRRRW
jgi:hypothetical protein